MEMPNFLKMATEEHPDEDTPLVDKANKAMFSLIPASALRAVAEVFTFGARKYSPNGWKGLSRELYLDAAHRHLNEYTIARQAGDLQPIDGESDLPVLAHAIASLLILMAMEEEHNAE